jgi:hexosaminidase
VTPLLPRPARLTVHDGQFTLTEASTVDAPPPIAALVRELLGPATGFGFPPGGDLIFTVTDSAPEEYRLTVTEQGIRATGSLTGLRWAVQTLRQMLPVSVYATGPVSGVPWTVPCVDIEDGPRYPWRGSLLDVGRWCLPIGFLFRYVDLMAVHKLNRLHLHLTEDQGWRFEVKRYPRLTEVGGYRAESSFGHARQRRTDGVPHGGFYTQRELADLVAYAARRGVQIMPEIDAPGHMQAAIAAYPELGNVPGRQLPVRTTWGISAHVLNTADATVAFLRDVLDEVTDVFPFGYVHIGGDEVPPDEWAASPDAQRRATKAGLSTVDGLVGWWAGQLATHLAGLGRRAAVWDELLDHGAPDGALVFGWRDASRVTAAQAAGHDVVAVPQRYAYFDWAESADPEEPLAIRGTVPLSTVYGYRPGEVAGVQGQLWTEYLPTPQLVEYRAYPRLAGFAEVGWTPGEERDFDDFRTRLEGHLARLDVLNVSYRRLD